MNANLDKIGIAITNVATPSMKQTPDLSMSPRIPDAITIHVLVQNPRLISSAKVSILFLHQISLDFLLIQCASSSQFMFYLQLEKQNSPIVHHDSAPSLY